MPDTLDAETRRRAMATVRSSNTAPEILVRQALHRAGYRFRLHRRDLSGSPDIVLPKYRFVVFVHGCFWHRHGCSRAKMPTTNVEYWSRKFEVNVERDRRVRLELESAGWTVAVVWTCNIEGGMATVIRELEASMGA